jgi:hypothetical protein
LYELINIDIIYLEEIKRKKKKKKKGKRGQRRQGSLAPSRSQGERAWFAALATRQAGWALAGCALAHAMLVGFYPSDQSKYGVHDRYDRIVALPGLRALRVFV